MRIRVLHGQSARPQPNAASSNASNAAFLAAGQGVEREFRARCSRMNRLLSVVRSMTDKIIELSRTARP